MSSIWVNGIVSHRDKLPYIQLSNDKGIFAQLSVAQARNVAMDMLQQACRAEADAMLRTFFDTNEFPQGACDALMIAFRDYRAKLDQEVVERTMSDPDTGEEIK